jgi:hypothetical protein
MEELLGRILHIRRRIYNRCAPLFRQRSANNTRG